MEMNFFESVDVAEHSMNAAEYLIARHAGVVRVTRHPDLILFRDRDHSF